MKDKKTVGAPFPNKSEIVRVVYDFAVDGGSIKKYDALVASDKMIVKLRHAHVITAVDAVGAIAISLGSVANEDEFLDGVLKAAMTIGAVLPSAGGNVLLAAGEKIIMDLAASAATVGKIEFVFEVVKAN
jgi:hypothetical protein